MSLTSGLAGTVGAVLTGVPLPYMGTIPRAHAHTMDRPVEMVHVYCTRTSRTRSRQTASRRADRHHRAAAEDPASPRYELPIWSHNLPKMHAG